MEYHKNGTAFNVDALEPLTAFWYNQYRQQNPATNLEVSVDFMLCLFSIVGGGVNLINSILNSQPIIMKLLLFIFLYKIATHLRVINI